MIWHCTVIRELIDIVPLNSPIVQPITKFYLFTIKLKLPVLPLKPQKCVFARLAQTAQCTERNSPISTQPRSKHFVVTPWTQQSTLYTGLTTFTYLVNC